MKKFFLISAILIIVNLSAQLDMQQVYYNISITGAVDKPGVYHMPPTSRLSEVVLISQGLTIKEIDPELKEKTEIELTPQETYPLNNSTNYLPEEEDQLKISLRKIQLKRKKKTILVDLQKFLLLGNESENPFLMDGDLIFIPALTNEVEIIGEVNNPGFHEIVENDRVSDILEFALGLTEAAYLENVEIIRYNSNDKFSTISINLAEVMQDQNSEDNILLKNGDKIYIRSIPQFQQYNEVTIFGEVEFPGTYIVNNNSTLSDLLERAGSITENADPSNSFLQRRNLEEQYDAEFERLKLISVEDMTYFEYEYFKTRAKELRGKFSFDLDQLNQSEVQENNIVLHDGDFIYIAEKISAVIVSGQVREPGLITYMPGKSPDYYIEQAGGLGWKARKGKIRIIRAETGEWLKPGKDLVLEEGDTILVPYRPDWNYWEIFKDTVVVLSQIATLFLVIQNVK